MRIPVKFKSVSPASKLPIRATQNSGAYDVYATEIVKESDDCCLVKLGFILEFPQDYKLIIAPRSSITKTKWNIQNTPGIGDADFRGEYSIRFRAFPEGLSVESYKELEEDGWGTRFYAVKKKYVLAYPEFPYKVGDRVAQIYFQKVGVVIWFETDNLKETQRGEGGYGSTGK